MTAQRFYTFITMSFNNNVCVFFPVVPHTFLQVSSSFGKQNEKKTEKRKLKRKKKEIETKHWNGWVALLTVYDFTLCVYYCVV